LGWGVARMRSVGVAGLVALGVGLLPAGAASAGDYGCTVETAVAGTDGKANLHLRINNTGELVINGWTLRFALEREQTVYRARNARVVAPGPDVQAVDVPTTAVVAPGRFVDVDLSFTHYVDGAAAPGAMSVNGQPCAVVSRPLR
jgi:hypothetical protein